MMLLLCAAFMAGWHDDAENKEMAVRARLQALLQKSACEKNLFGKCLEISSSERESWFDYENPKRPRIAKRTTWIFLQPTDPTNGTVWVIQELNGVYDSKKRKPGDLWQAWKGEYTLSIDRVDEELLHVCVESNRRFVGTGERPASGDADVDWSIDTKYVRKWMDVQIPLIDGQVPERKVQLSIKRARLAEPGSDGTNYRDVTFPAASPFSDLPRVQCVDFGYLELTRTTKTLTSTPGNWLTPPPGFKLNATR